MRSQILAAATRLFAARGFEGTSLQDIAAQVGISKPAVLHHFVSKEQLRRAVLDSILEHWQKTLPALLLAATAGEDRFEAVLSELHRFFATDRDRARLVMREALDRPDEVRSMLLGPVRPWLTAVAGYIEKGRLHGVHHVDVDPEAYVLHAMQLVISAAAAAPIFRQALGEGPVAKARYERELFRLARASLFPPSSFPADPDEEPLKKNRKKAPR
jgi:TetR/AcrR family transcriptional regulator